jgi:glycerol-3-phosphate responsive antiterminator
MNHTDIVIKEWQHLDSLVNGEDSHSVVLTGHALTIPDIVAVSRFASPLIIPSYMVYGFSWLRVTVTIYTQTSIRLSLSLCSPV